MVTQSNKGKSSEKEVQDELTKWSNQAAKFEVERHYDAHSAGGRFAKVAGDFGWYTACTIPAKFGLIEVKEVNHDYRLPYKNFENVGKLVKRQLAGGIILVLVHHTTTGLWRPCPLWLFMAKDPTKPSGSWDLTGQPAYQTLQEALAEFKTLVGVP